MKCNYCHGTGSENYYGPRNPDCRVCGGTGEKPIINLCNNHYKQSDWPDKDVIITGRQSCDICKDK